MFNPKIKDFLKEKPDLTVMGLFWAGWWRLYVAVLGIALAFGALSALFNQ
jgi:hypothetical protein